MHQTQRSYRHGILAVQDDEPGQTGANEATWLNVQPMDGIETSATTLLDRLLRSASGHRVTLRARAAGACDDAVICQMGENGMTHHMMNTPTL